VADLCRKVNANVRSMGIALTSCTVPAAGQPTFSLDETEMEIGIGIHGEPGRQRIAVKSADEITELMAEATLSDLPFVSGDEVIVMVNGMGGTPLIELYIIYGTLARICAERGIKIGRNLIGNYITSLEMAGASITMLKADAQMLSLWDAPVKTLALRWGM
jgi:dihydroxyacetone kinase-like protein